MNITRFKKRAKVCGICMNEVEFQGRIDGCHHIFCFDCVEQWAQIENTCPWCKLRFNSITKIPHRVDYANSGKRQKTLYVSNKNQSLLLEAENFNSFIENAQRMIEAEYELLLRRL